MLERPTRLPPSQAYDFGNLADVTRPGLQWLPAIAIGIEPMARSYP
jgi:hypothetical protein